MRNDSPYYSLRGIIVDFLHAHGLAAQYIENLRPDQQCVGCTRDGGDHDMECSADNLDGVHDVKYRSTTNEPYESQVRWLLKLSEMPKPPNQMV